MKLSPSSLSLPVSLLDTAHGRQRLLTAVLNLVHGTRLEPQAYERMLLDQFVRGELTIEQVQAQLEVQESG